MLAMAAFLMFAFSVSGSSLVAQQPDERARAAEANAAKLKNCNLYPPQRTSPYVKQAQAIALSGNTGDTGGGAHLHFDVQQCGPALPPNYNQLPCGQTLPGHVPQYAAACLRPRVGGALPRREMSA